MTTVTDFFIENSIVYVIHRCIMWYIDDSLTVHGYTEDTASVDSRLFRCLQLDQIMNKGNFDAQSSRHVWLQ